MTNWYKPRYKMSYILQNKIWSYQRSRLRGMYDKRGSILFRRGYIHRQKRVLKNLKWIRIRRRFGFSNVKKFSWRIRRRRNRFLHVKRQYKINLQQKQGLLTYYGKLDQNNLKRIYKNYFLKTKNFKLLSLIKNLELRLHVILYKLKVFPTIYSAHQYISHKGVLINNILSKQPSKILNVGDIIKFPKKYWLIINYYLYNKFYNRLHREILNWARGWYKLYWYKRLINSIVWDKSLIFKNKNNYFKILNNSKHSEYLWKIRKKKIKQYGLNSMYVNKVTKKYFFILKKNWIRFNIWKKKYNKNFKKYRNNLKKNKNNLNQYNKILKNYNNKLLNNNFKFFIKNNLKKNILWTRNFSFFWIFNKIFINKKNKFKFSPINISMEVINKNLSYIYNTKNIDFMNTAYNVEYRKDKSKKSFYYNQLFISDNIISKIYHLKLLKKVELIYIRLYTWVLKYANKKEDFMLKNFVILYKYIAKELNIIYSNIYKIQKLYNLIKYIKLILFNNIINNKNKLIIKKLFYKLIYLQYKLKLNLNKFNLIIYNNNILNKEYISFSIMFLKNMLAVSGYVFNINFSNEGRFILLNEFSDKYLNSKEIIKKENEYKDENEKKKDILFQFKLNTIEYVMDVKNYIFASVDLNYDNFKKFKENYDEEKLNDVTKVILFKLQILYRKGYEISQIKKYIKDQMCSLIYMKNNKDNFYIDLSYYEHVNRGIEYDAKFKIKDISENEVFFDKLMFLKNKKKIVNDLLRIDFSSANHIDKIRKLRIKKYIIFYNYLYKIKLKKKKRLKRIYEDFFIKKNVRSIIWMTLYDTNIKKLFKTSKNKNIFKVIKRISPLWLNRVNLLFNIYNKIRLLNINLYDLSNYDTIFKRRISKNYYRFNKKYNIRNKMISLSNINKKYFRLHFLLKKRIRRYKRYNSKFKGFFIQQFWYIPKYIEIDWLSYRLIIISEPYSSDIISSLGDYNLIRSVLGFFSRYGF